MTTLQDLISTSTLDQELADELVVAQAQGLQTTTWQPGSVVRTILTVVAQKFSDFSQTIVAPIRGGFGDLLSDIRWARVWAKGTYNVDAVLATAATGYITITNSTSTAYNHGPGEIIVAHSSTGKTYRNTVSVPVTALSTIPNVPVAADEVGTPSNAAAGTVTVLVGPSMPGVTVTNPAAILGSDDETVEALVARARGSLAAISALGPKDAFNYVAKSPIYAAVGTAITRAVTFNDPTNGNVNVYIANAGGAPSSADVAIVQTALDTWAEPWCVTSTAIAATPVTIPVAYEIWVKTTLTQTQITTAIATALSVYFSNVPIGGTLTSSSTGSIYVNELIVTIGSTTLDGTVDGTPLGVIRALVSLPNADVALANNQVAVLGTITPTVHFL